jgi:hypothetical protein
MPLAREYAPTSLNIRNIKERPSVEEEGKYYGL